MVRDNSCPKCEGELNGYYIEEGHILYASRKLTCKKCRFSFEGCLDEEELG
jgi:uncharacterized protein YbaR (Trm112 family)